MIKLRGYPKVLQREISADDVQWRYDVQGLLGPEKIDAAGLIKHITVLSSFKRECIELSFEAFPLSRATSAEPCHKFLSLSFGDFKLRTTRSKRWNEVTFATDSDSSEYIARLLKTGVHLNGVNYHFFGHSGSQLGTRSCLLFAASKNEIKAKIEAMGDFSTLESVRKKVKRIGHLFSSANMALQLPVERCEEINDITIQGYNFTDGCGLLSPALAKQLVQQHNIVYRNQRYLPSVFQIRYQGCKGVLTISPELRGRILVQFRKSMRKFKGSQDPSLLIIDYSKVSTSGLLAPIRDANFQIALRLRFSE